ncbi:hypothetical protein IWW37_004415 [Coemansia sp. RSA 2050]|nr:hypothetical protein IWW37_004415 [Coemansia sp. RSA 2050]KAJ2731521.1 hypothetical protein IW152_004494 [Coemansia sp. BCRC 34962]
MDKYASSSQQLTLNQRETLPQSHYRHRASSGAESTVTGGWATFHPAPRRPHQPYPSPPAIAASTHYCLTPFPGVQIPGTQIPGPPMHHMSGALLHNPAQVAFQPVNLVGSAPSALGYPQARRIRCTQACNYCHKRKARCVRNVFADGSSQCDNCLRDNMPCEWRQSRRRGPRRRGEDKSYGESYSMDSEGQGSTGFGNEWTRRGIDSGTSTKSTLSIANLLNVTDDRSRATDNSEYVSSLVQ